MGRPSTWSANSFDRKTHMFALGTVAATMALLLTAPGSHGHDRVPATGSSTTEVVQTSQVPLADR